MLRVGIEGEGRLTVTENDTAAAVGSGSLRVFATPAMAALMEKTALDSVAPFLEEGATTVGTALDIRHTAATPVGLEVVCRSTLTAVDGRRLVFSLSVEDACGPSARVRTSALSSRPPNSSRRPTPRPAGDEA